LLRARQACAENRSGEVREILASYGDEVNVNTGNPMWLLSRMLGENERAIEVLRHFEDPQVPFILASWLSYRQFDPAPFPALLQILQRESVDRPPPRPLPYACTQKPT
jgi:hypothetical protein